MALTLKDDSITDQHNLRFLKHIFSMDYSGLTVDRLTRCVDAFV